MEGGGEEKRRGGLGEEKNGRMELRLGLLSCRLPPFYTPRHSPHSSCCLLTHPQSPQPPLTIHHAPLAHAYTTHHTTLHTAPTPTITA